MSSGKDEIFKAGGMVHNTHQTASRCGKTVSWWDGEYEGECELPENHQGPHYDGISCFTDDGDEVELKSLPIPPYNAVLSYYKGAELLARQSSVLSGPHYLLEMKVMPDIVIKVELIQ